MEVLQQKLRKLRLSGLARSLGQHNAYALEHRISYLDFLELLIEDEIALRQSNSYQRRLKQSRLSQQKMLQNYDFNYQPSLDKRLIQELAACRFLTEAKNVILMGNPGVGKTHLAQALGLEALKLGYQVRFAHIHELLEEFRKARALGRFTNQLHKLLRVDLLILDELGFRKITGQELDDFFELIRRTYENGSLIMTTNRNFEDWPHIFGDAVLASAIVDRLVHRSTVIKITGESYRIKAIKSKK